MIIVDLGDAPDAPRCVAIDIGERAASSALVQQMKTDVRAFDDRVHCVPPSSLQDYAVLVRITYCPAEQCGYYKVYGAYPRGPNQAIPVEPNVICTTTSTSDVIASTQTFISFCDTLAFFLRPIAVSSDSSALRVTLYNADTLVETNEFRNGDKFAFSVVVPPDSARDHITMINLSCDTLEIQALPLGNLTEQTTDGNVLVPILNGVALLSTLSPSGTPMYAFEGGDLTSEKKYTQNNGDRAEVYFVFVATKAAVDWRCIDQDGLVERLRGLSETTLSRVPPLLPPEARVSFQNARIFA
jgi:hypothetical protein